MNTKFRKVTFLERSNRELNNASDSQSFKWKDVNWIKIQIRLSKLQNKIYEAKKKNNIVYVRKLQKTILNSHDAKKLAVRRITQLNRGKNTPGVDGIKSLNETERVSLVNNLRIRGWAEPVRRVWYEEPGSLKKRPLGIPTIYDRALQALFAFALEPEFEAIFEKNSLGFRLGRGPIDAMKQVQLSCQQAEKYVLVADIAKCFDNINHGKLLQLVGHKGKVRKQIKAWLESGNIFEGMFTKTVKGTPQGGVLSPLLANIALDGMEKLIANWAINQKLYNPDGKPIQSRRGRISTINYIRYADDFRIMHREVDVVISLEKLVGEFLAERGLHLNEAKTKIVHTRLPYKTEKAGFNFLGFTVKHFDSIHRSAYTSHKKRLGYRLLIYPSKESRINHLGKIDEHIRRYKTANESYIINKLNPIIIGWCNYYRYSHFLTTRIAASMDYVLFKKLLAWAKRKLQVPNNLVGYRRFWQKIAGKLVFTYRKHNKRYKILASYREVAKSTSLVKYVKVKGEKSVYDGDVSYWSRRAISPELKTTTKVRLLKRQDYRCNICKVKFTPDDIIETDHIHPIARGGKHRITNLQLVHASPCHDYKK